MKGILIILMVSFCYCSMAQADSSYVHNRKKAALLSIMLPGAGQFYNELGHRKVQGRKNISWWRAPLFIGGLVTTSYFGVVNARSAIRHKQEWEFREGIDFQEGFTLYPEFEEFSKSNLEDNFIVKTSNRDYAIAGFALIYALNVVDAFVDAHFVSFDVSNDLSLNFKPRYFGPSEFGCTLSFNFR